MPQKDRTGLQEQGLKTGQGLGKCGKAKKAQGLGGGGCSGGKKGGGNIPGQGAKGGGRGNVKGRGRS